MVTKRNLHIIPGLRIFVGAVICPCVLAPSAGGFYLSHKARRLFTVGTFGDTQCGSGPPVLRMDGARFNPRKKFFFREYRAASELPVRDSVFVDLIVERGPGGGYALFGQEQSGIFDVHAVCLDGLVLAPEVGEFGKNRVYCIADDGLQLCGSGDDNRFIHTLTLLIVLQYPLIGRIAQR